MLEHFRMFEFLKTISINLLHPKRSLADAIVSLK